MNTKYDIVFAKDKLLEIAKEMQKSHFKPGYDNMTARNALLWIEINYENLLARLMTDKYKPQPLMGFSVSKKNGTFRQLTKPCAIDMILQKALTAYLNEITKGIFSEHTHAYMQGRGVTTAVREFCRYAEEYNYVLKIDLSRYFDSIDHTVLEEMLSDIGLPKKLINLIFAFVKAPIIEDGKASRCKTGIPQGIPISPILANLYLVKLDRFLKNKGYPYVRYADDTAVFGNDIDGLKELYKEAAAFFEKALALEVNAEKCTVDIPENMRFLGHKFQRNSIGVISTEANIPAPVINEKWTASPAKKNNRHITVLRSSILSKKDFAMQFDSNGEKYTVPVYGCDSINVYSDAVFDSDFFAQAANNRISVNIFNKYGKKLGSFIPSTRLYSPPATLEQILHYGDKDKRLYLASRFVLGSIHNLRLNIRYYRKNYKNTLFTESLNAIDTLEKLIKKCDEYEKLLLLEARVRNAYYHCFDAFIRADGYKFDKRTRRPPKNEVNAMLSFGYTVLYNLIATEIDKTALDVRVGFLHATGKRRESLNLDIAELFKPLIVDRVVFSMINRDMLDKSRHFNYEENGTVYLSPEGKHIFLRMLSDKLDTCVTVGKQSVPYREIIENEIKKLIRYFRKNEKRYVPFKQVR